MNDLMVMNKTEDEEKQFIVFRINKEYFGMDIFDINSIIMMPEITKMPKAPEYMQGVINLRGHVVPIMSLRKRMNYGEENITKDSRIIIVNLENDELMGVIVDDVKEVMNIPTSEIVESSPFVKKEDSFISGVGKKDDELISIFEVEKLIA
ncbi:chemotaxis protein CheW [Pseudobutyrivibrio xylanivorans]|uniref:Purine-binding chemotaxis protein CheW n=1 Tax=Pseudobutyrivibrio xylanivorans TaxID=185007 RepID=A0A5P6VT66_PSEXY|nr:chemotaxis protein CheW [Pseudobutyrivibrio xylanivorans]QFJ55806.1 purine-binding chemotaxis protein CheW [Pseudobutyrivibrio xylanivorans]